MARCMEVVERSLKELEKEITCTICQEHFTQPKVLPCHHYYCKECILKLTLRTGKDKPFSCPKCHKEAILPEGNIDNLKTAFFINRFTALYGKQERNLDKITQLPTTLIIINRSASTRARKAEVNKLSEFRLYANKLCDNEPAKSVFQIECLLKSLYNGSVTESDIKYVGADQYCIQYTPTVRGRHELAVSVDGQPIAGSPFPMFVSIPLTQLDEPIKFLGQLTEPNGITVNSVGEIIVAELEEVVVLDKEGRRLRSIRCSEYQVKYLRGIAVDSEDNIYFTDLEASKIFKSNKNCSKVQVHTVQQVKGPGHIDVAIVGDEVMVTERGNQGRIMVYDRELKYVRRIVGKDGRTFHCLSSDSHRNVYVSVRWNLSIQVYSNDGKFLRSFGNLKCPYGICVAGGYVYVTDLGVYKIVVFTTQGDFVATFGGSIYRAVDVCADQDGFVYASDCKFNRIHIF